MLKSGPAFNVYVASHVFKPQLVLVDEMASQSSVSEGRHEEASVIRGHRVYKAMWTPVVGEELNLA